MLATIEVTIKYLRKHSEEVLVSGKSLDNFCCTGAGVSENWRDQVSDSTPQYEANKPEGDHLQHTKQMDLLGTNL